jgi:GH25 family lysozyme M1 (1,4-beta-N-acetylmuramidase)
MADPKIVDLSHYQAGFDFAAFAASGGIAVVLKATEGASHRDSSYATFSQQAIDAGLVYASYHFLRPGDMASQAQFFLTVVDPVEGERVVADHEDSGVSLDDLKTFLKSIQSLRPDLQLSVYSGNLIEQQLGGAKDDWLSANTSLWTPQYASSPSPWPTATWPNWSLWQHTDSASVAGFAGAVDGNQFNGSDDQCLKWFGPPPPQPAPPAAVTVNLTIASDQPINLIVNGVPFPVSS